MTEHVIHLTHTEQTEVKWRPSKMVVVELREALRSGPLVADYDFAQQAIVLRPLEDE